MPTNSTTTAKRGSQQRNIQRCTTRRHTGRSRASTICSSPACFLPELFSVSFVSYIPQVVFAYASLHTGYSASSPSHSIFPTAIRTNSKLYNCFTRMHLPFKNIQCSSLSRVTGFDLKSSLYDIIIASHLTFFWSLFALNIFPFFNFQPICIFGFKVNLF